MTDAGEMREVTVRTGGRDLEVLVDAAEGGLALVYHSGTPSGPAPYEPLRRAAADAGLRLVTYGRPGYGRSTPHPGRSVADATGDTAAILDHLGIDDFVTLGWSGGGPHALACGALLAPRCRSVATIGGVAPPGAAGLDWDAGMGPENIEEFGLARQGAEALRPFLLIAEVELREVTGAQVAASLGGLVPPVDRESMTGDYAEWLAACFRKAVQNGVAGWSDDDLAFVRPWGFEPADVRVPVSLWQGGQDLMVPAAHGAWLAQALPDARPHLLPDEGHISLGVGSLDAILRELAELGGASGA